MALEFLRKIGLSDGEIKVYSSLLDLGKAPLNKIHERTGIERRNIYDILNKLIERGLISYTLEKGKKTYQCTPPSRIIDEIKRRQNNLKELEKTKEEIKSGLDLIKKSEEIAFDIYSLLDESEL